MTGTRNETPTYDQNLIIKNYHNFITCLREINPFLDILYPELLLQLDDEGVCYGLSSAYVIFANEASRGGKSWLSEFRIYLDFIASLPTDINQMRKRMRNDYQYWSSLHKHTENNHLLSFISIIQEAQNATKVFHKVPIQWDKTVTVNTTKKNLAACLTNANITPGSLMEVSCGEFHSFAMRYDGVHYYLFEPNSINKPSAEKKFDDIASLADEITKQYDKTYSDTPHEGMDLSIRFMSPMKNQFDKCLNEIKNELKQIKIKKSKINKIKYIIKLYERNNISQVDASLMLLETFNGEMPGIEKKLHILLSENTINDDTKFITQSDHVSYVSLYYIVLTNQYILKNILENENTYEWLSTHIKIASEMFKAALISNNILALNYLIEKKLIKEIINYLGQSEDNKFNPLFDPIFENNIEVIDILLKQDLPEITKYILPSLRYALEKNNIEIAELIIKKIIKDGLLVPEKDIANLINLSLKTNNIFIINLILNNFGIANGSLDHVVMLLPDSYLKSIGFPLKNDSDFVLMHRIKPSQLAKMIRRKLNDNSSEETEEIFMNNYVRTNKESFSASSSSSSSEDNFFALNETSDSEDEKPEKNNVYNENYSAFLQSLDGKNFEILYDFFYKLNKENEAKLEEHIFKPPESNDDLLRVIACSVFNNLKNEDRENVIDYIKKNKDGLELFFKRKIIEIFNRQQDSQKLREIQKIKIIQLALFSLPEIEYRKIMTTIPIEKCDDAVNDYIKNARKYDANFNEEQFKNELLDFQLMHINEIINAQLAFGQTSVEKNIIAKKLLTFFSKIILEKKWQVSGFTWWNEIKNKVQVGEKEYILPTHVSKMYRLMQDCLHNGASNDNDYLTGINKFMEIGHKAYNKKSNSFMNFFNKRDESTDNFYKGFRNDLWINYSKRQ